ncbi:DNA replication licensing factor Mcm3 [Aspergillus luchuensis]|uniref:DNA replication licensing factor Mcm3 n=1 Tax=Aspergillus kawachii TaxID=1069201 RepID=A0A146FPD7_ASPKA|nr:DNA replication licensing factor Mcm3 [Aspergillus luchuensis]
MEGQFDDAAQDRVRAAVEFLDPTYGFPKLMPYVAQVSIDEIRAHNREMADGLLTSPYEYSDAFEKALKEIIKTLPNRPSRETGDDVVWETGHLHDARLASNSI